jgi:predicted amidophosphoribosyltransferase
LLSLVLPMRCAGCQQIGPVLCSTCRFAMSTSPAVSVPGGVTAALTFHGVVRDVLVSLKYRNRRAAASELADLLVRRLGFTDPGGAPFDLVTWAPTSRRRVAERGFDQAEVLARAVASRLGVPCRRLLYRVHGDPQTGRGRVERLAGPAFRARTAPARRWRVLVLDDVVTTGATLAAAAEALRAAGLVDVRLVAVAATPGHADLRERATGRLESA